jgi:hypothetical protein
VDGPKANEKGTHRYRLAPLGRADTVLFNPKVEGSIPSGPTVEELVAG